MCSMVLGGHLDSEVLRDLHLENNTQTKTKLLVH